MSFGYRDEDWVNPPEYDEPIVESSVSIDIGGKLVVVDDWGIEFVQDHPFEGEFDDKTGTLIMEGDGIAEEILESIEEPPNRFGVYKIYGEVSFDYDIWDDGSSYLVEIPGLEISDIEFRFVKDLEITNF